MLSIDCLHIRDVGEDSFYIRYPNESELKRIEWQLGEVFGPLRAILLCTKANFSALVKRHRAAEEAHVGSDRRG